MFGTLKKYSYTREKIKPVKTYKKDYVSHSQIPCEKASTSINISAASHKWPPPQSLMAVSEWVLCVWRITPTENLLSLLMNEYDVGAWSGRCLSMISRLNNKIVRHCSLSRFFLSDFGCRYCFGRRMFLCCCAHPKKSGACVLLSMYRESI